jgi:hypothetical protein
VQKTAPGEGEGHTMTQEEPIALRDTLDAVLTSPDGGRE